MESKWEPDEEGIGKRSGGGRKKRREGNKMREKRKERKGTLIQEVDLLRESQISFLLLPVH